LWSLQRANEGAVKVGCDHAAVRSAAPPAGRSVAAAPCAIVHTRAAFLKVNNDCRGIVYDCVLRNDRSTSAPPRRCGARIKQICGFKRPRSGELFHFKKNSEHTLLIHRRHCSPGLRIFITVSSLTKDSQTQPFSRAAYTNFSLRSPRSRTPQAMVKKSAP
jgi:hypothetical protein